jgi:hypothetical protein
MRRRVLTLIFVLVALPCSTLGHGGRTDSRGGHHDRKNGGYHFHHGMGPHQHPGGVCPYASSGSSSKSGTSRSGKSGPGFWTYALIGIAALGAYNWWANRED